ncbi:hypothetical protein CPB86DRAFT_785555 [Serendipita vermifera]|nr:hypothetical protein CPB86DRAFT_785555 [Serendipita vermifera]
MEDPTGLDLPQYPHSEKKILLTWQARNRACLEVLHRLKRSNNCGALERDEMATLTKDSV